MKALFLVGVLLSVCALGSGDDSWNLGKKNLALSGYDAVSYFSGDGPHKGNKSFETLHGGARYRFASAESQACFEAEPDRYLPVCGGWCAWAMLEGDKVDINPETFKIFDGRLLLFYDGFWGDTLRRWEEKSEGTPEAKLFETVESNWKRILEKQ